MHLFDCQSHGRFGPAENVYVRRCIRARFKHRADIQRHRLSFCGSKLYAYVVKEKTSENRFEYHNCLILYYARVRYVMIYIGHIRGLQLHGVCVRADWMR